MERSIKIMLLGIAFMLLGLFIQGEPGIEMYGNEFFIVLLGFMMTLFGVFAKR
ncbi:hypothetical protein [Paenibacillus mendelii]|uniref:Uncharacterized protein n=1 Tax=Paenibacillus mendelii TaxID=206163 RepID=A0ABV6JK77_9BACL|nr:hypothetical protein [Paenibacillus mendelii]MCQ6559902.1 hypothetical protein [Paenibacillus mendelii]